MARYLFVSPHPDDDVIAMGRAAGATRYAGVTIAAKTSSTGAGTCHPGDVLGLVHGDIVEIGDKASLRLDLEITAVSGTAPRMHVQIETRKAYGAGTWRVVDAFEIASAVSSQRRAMGGCDRFVRAVCTLSGTSPSFTFSLTGEAV